MPTLKRKHSVWAGEAGALRGTVPIRHEMGTNLSGIGNRFDADDVVHTDCRSNAKRRPIHRPAYHRRYGALIASKRVSKGANAIMGLEMVAQVSAESKSSIIGHPSNSSGRLPSVGIDDTITASVVPIAKTIESQSNVMACDTIQTTADTVDTTSPDMGPEYDSRRSRDGSR